MLFESISGLFLDMCLKPGVETYPIHDGSCRTYMKCNAVEGDERWCCPSNNVYDPSLQACVPRTPDMNLLCDDTCPLSYRECRCTGYDIGHVI